MTLPNPSESDVFECCEERGGCGRTFGTDEEFGDRQCSPTNTPALSMLVTHRLIVNGRVASCKCGAWECRTNEVVEADVLKTLQRQYCLHFKQLGVFSDDLSRAVQ